jgi:hypothetical protein
VRKRKTYREILEGCGERKMIYVLKKETKRKKRGGESGERPPFKSD